LNLVSSQEGEHLLRLPESLRHLDGFHHASSPFRETADFPE
jgi:hypothetical protein